MRTRCVNRVLADSTFEIDYSRVRRRDLSKPHTARSSFAASAYQPPISPPSQRQLQIGSTPYLSSQHKFGSGIHQLDFKHPFSLSVVPLPDRLAVPALVQIFKPFDSVSASPLVTLPNELTHISLDE
ncbi:hypothetical protein NMY22_g14557 [Coprinellus aureogranulatus]|nr:hypothetical protein NMY22_g14557 [Coprinellus aureogranulatus]